MISGPDHPCGAAVVMDRKLIWSSGGWEGTCALDFSEDVDLGLTPAAREPEIRVVSDVPRTLDGRLGAHEAPHALRAQLSTLLPQTPGQGSGRLSHLGRSPDLGSADSRPRRRPREASGRSDSCLVSLLRGKSSIGRSARKERAFLEDLSWSVVITSFSWDPPFLQKACVGTLGLSSRPSSRPSTVGPSLKPPSGLSWTQRWRPSKSSSWTTAQRVTHRSPAVSLEGGGLGAGLPTGRGTHAAFNALGAVLEPRRRLREGI